MSVDKKVMAILSSESLQPIILAVIIGTLAAIVYSLRILVLMERRVARMDENILAITKRIAAEELKIEAEEQKIERMLSGRRNKTGSGKAKKSKKKR